MPKKKLNPARNLTGTLAYLSNTPAYSNMARIWRDKDFGSFRYVDWEILEPLGFRQQLEDILSYHVDGIPHKFEAFKRLYSIDEPVYMEMVTEFMTTYSYHQGNNVSESTITFQYLGASYTRSLAQFAQYLGLYTIEEVQLPIFTEGATSMAIETTHAEAWSRWSTRPYFSGIKASQLHDPVLQILHKLIACSLDGKYTTNGRVSEFDIAVMTKLLEKKNIQVAHLVAARIQEEKEFGKRRSYMGAVITRLIRGMGLLRSTDVAKFLSLPKWTAKRVDYDLLNRMEVIRIQLDGTTYIRARLDDPRTRDRLVHGLVLPRGLRKRIRRKQHSGSESDEDDLVEQTIPVQQRAGPSVPAQRAQVPIYTYHFGAQPGPEYHYWMMQMQIRLYRSRQQELAGLPVSPLPDLPCALGRPPFAASFHGRPPHPHHVVRPHPRAAAPQPPRPRVAPVPDIRQSVPSVVGSFRGHPSDSRRTRNSRHIATSHGGRDEGQPSHMIIASTHGQSDLFGDQPPHDAQDLPLFSFDLPSEAFVDQMIQNEAFILGVPSEGQAPVEGRAPTEGRTASESDSSSSRTSTAST